MLFYFLSLAIVINIIIFALAIMHKTTKLFKMNRPKVLAMPFSTIYPLYINKIVKKGRTINDLNEIIFWLTGYDAQSLQKQIDDGVSLEAFFDQAPNINPNTYLIKGVICGVRVEDIEDKMMQKIRYMDKLVDELAKGKTIDKILRQDKHK